MNKLVWRGLTRGSWHVVNHEDEIVREVHGEHGMAGAPAECPGEDCRWRTSLRESIDAQTCKGCGAIDSMGGASLVLSLCPACAKAARVPCAMCLKPWQGNYSIHRDGLGVGPELPLCDACGGSQGPTCEEIWTRRATPTTVPTVARERRHTLSVAHYPQCG